MSDTNLTLTRELGGVEDLLLDANLPATVVQARLVGDTVQNITVHKINWDTFPVAGKYGDSNFISLHSMLDDMNARKTRKCAIDDTGRGLCITMGEAGVIWDGGTPTTDEFTLAQVLPNGHYRWVGKGTSGSDKFTFRGRVAGLDGVDAEDFITKAQYDILKAYIDTVKAIADTQSDWDETNSSSTAFILHKPDIPPSIGSATLTTEGLVKCGNKDMLTEGTDTECRGWTAKDLKDFSDANPGGGCWVSGHLVVPHTMQSSSFDVTSSWKTLVSGVSSADFGYIVKENATYEIRNAQPIGTVIRADVYLNNSKVGDGGMGGITVVSVAAEMGDLLGMLYFGSTGPEIELQIRKVT